MIPAPQPPVPGDADCAEINGARQVLAVNKKVGYLGPAGTFTHQAAQKFANVGSTLLIPFDNVGQIFEALETGQIGYGVAAIDNTVEGPVFATVDGLLNYPDIVASGGKWLPIQFDAYVLQDGAAVKDFEFGVAHPHALAQVAGYLKQHNLKPLAAASNGAALENLQPGQVAFGPPGFEARTEQQRSEQDAKPAPGVVTIARNVGDYSEAKTLFVKLEKPWAPLRPHCGWDPAELAGDPQTVTMLAITPTDTGPGVLARITREFADQGLNLSALFSRPIKGEPGKYVFIVTVDAYPWDHRMETGLAAFQAAGDEVTTLGMWSNRSLQTESRPTLGSDVEVRVGSGGQSFSDVEAWRDFEPKQTQSYTSEHCDRSDFTKTSSSDASGSFGPKVAVIGLGLIGGSVALRCVARGCNIVGYDDDAVTRLAAAQHFPVAQSLPDAVADADLVVLAVPLKAMGATAQALGAAVAAGQVKPNAIITDVGSVKAPVGVALEAAGLGAQYIGLHPMAGNEHSGFAAADPMLLVGATWVLTTADAERNLKNQLIRWVTDTFDANIIELTEAEHDQAQALISGLPHVFATELLNLLAAAPSSGPNNLKQAGEQMAAGSFRDGTRVAHTDPNRTMALIEENASNIVPLLHQAATDLTALANQLASNQNGSAFFHQADQLR